MKNTRKKILAMILALVMAMTITASAAGNYGDYYDGSTITDWADYTDKYNINDSAPIDETDLSQYTAENSKYAIRNGEIVSFPNIFTPDGKADPDPRHGWAFHNNTEPYNTRINEITDTKTPIGTVRETWDYLRENFNVFVANRWFTTTNGKNSALLDWLLNGDADRQYSYIFKNYGRYEAWSYIDHACGYEDPAATDESLLLDFASPDMYPKNGKTVGTSYILTVPTMTTPEPTPTPTPNYNGQQTTQSKEENAQALWEQSIRENENNRNYLQVLEHNREMMAQEVDPAGYQYTIVTEDIQNKSDEICAGATNDGEKLRLIHDWVSNNIYYDYVSYYAGTYGWKTAQQTLDDGRGVCCNYAVLTQALLWAQDIPSTFVFGYTTHGRWSRPDSTGGAHAWNTALIDGEWVTVDTTWDSQNRYYGSNQYSDDCKLTYFCPTIEFFSTNHRIDKIGMALDRVNANLEKATSETIQIVQQTQEIVQELDEGLKVENYLAQVQEQVKADTSLSAWAKEEILTAIGKNLVPDCILGEFNQDITRGEFCELVQQMTWQVVGMELKDYVKANQYTLTYDAFADVPVWSKYADSVACVQALGIIQGYGNGNFGPDDSLTWQEAATILARWAKLLGLDLSAGQTSQFADQGQIADWANESVGMICGCGVMEGTGQGFAPLAHYTREQAIATALRIYDQT